ncbi:glycoside hydrolase family 19 protein [Pseudanabaena sp. PCC 6802]|uniref:glycoside hydrolase family 19 protein n=1 Tax=Pseudanabaena sp. PCC 6802 TaxID=118173 RepID=UPI000361E443|nr:glycoside hydrolase family 19 protein [Pseudanabaena sp. PCC 6802]
MAIKRKEFYEGYRKFFRPTLSQSEVDGYEAMFDYWDSSGLTDLRWLAYAIATAYHETGELMEPVREGFCNTDACSINAVTDLFDRGIIGVNYALPDPGTGKSYFGRGLVQLTFAANYKKMGKEIGKDLYNHPELALDLKTSVEILFKGMEKGLFTGLRFADFFNSGTDWVHARKIINDMDRANLIAGYAQDFFVSLQ